ncbi:MAG: hypothetical protein GX081_00005, partial [Firmicutes bacterium]|nr:hypothetical protein [Bacillota bacterium]
ASPPAAILNLYCYEKMLTPGLKYRLGANFFFLFSELVYPWEINMAPAPVLV